MSNTKDSSRATVYTSIRGSVVMRSAFPSAADPAKPRGARVFLGGACCRMSLRHQPGPPISPGTRCIGVQPICATPPAGVLVEYPASAAISSTDALKE